MEPIESRDGSEDAMTFVVVRCNNGEERLLLSNSPDLLPPLDVDAVKASFLTPAPVRGSRS